MVVDLSTRREVEVKVDYIEREVEETVEETVRNEEIEKQIEELLRKREELGKKLAEIDNKIAELRSKLVVAKTVKVKKRYAVIKCPICNKTYTLTVKDVLRVRILCSCGIILIPR